ncbi:diguanylate cyclase [Magnetovibrio sp. PR-2]|uniref:diguanylate cyclase domain-containing protein n=1 Tax=Magnetovibrio sp. PR-2 TaxID=3120356 RepID=UPI002FCE2565
MRVLHIEDEHAHHEHTKRLLAEIYGSKLDMHWADTFDFGVRAIQQGNEYDLVLLDYDLSDGHDATEVLRDVDAANLNVPFIVISALDALDFDVEALRYGADDYLLKGHFTAKDLKRAITFATYRKDKMSSLSKMAFYDRVSTLPNRQYLTEYTEKSIHISTRVGRFVGVFYIDVDDLDGINKAHGTECGDQVLKVFGDRIQQILRKTDTTVRAGGDEFIAVSPGITRMEHVEDLMSKLRAKLTGNIVYKDSRVKIGCSIGSAMIPGDTDNLDDAIKLAYKSMRADQEKRTS